MADLDDPRTLAVPADAAVHLPRDRERNVAVDGWASVELLRQSYAGLARALADLGEQLRAVTTERDQLAAAPCQAIGPADGTGWLACTHHPDGRHRCLGTDRHHNGWHLCSCGPRWTPGTTGNESRIAIPDPPAPRTLTWDLREQPDLDQLARALHDLTGGAIGLHQVDTGSDQYAIVLASTPLTPEQAHAVWAAEDPNAGEP